MSKVGEAYVEIRAKTDKFEKDLVTGVDDALDKVSQSVDGVTDQVNVTTKSFVNWSGAIQKAALPAGIALAAVGTMATKAVGAASNLGESINAVNVVFGKASEGILALSKDAATAVGLSQTEFNGLAVQFSSFAEKIAGPGGDIVGTIQSISTRAADFASVMNLEVADAARIFQSGLAGETEPLKRFGIDLSEAAVKAYAMANGIGDGSGQLTEQEKILARHGALMEQTAKTQGDFANTSDSLANRQRIVGSQFKDLQADLGNALIPAFEALLAVGQKVIEFVKENTTLVLILVGAVTAFAAAIVGLSFAFKAYEIIKKTVIAAQWAWNAALNANPIGLVIVAIAAAIAIVVLLYKRFEVVRTVVQTVVNAVVGYFEFMINMWIKGINMFTGALNKITGVLGIFGINVGKIGEIAEVSFGRMGDAANKATVNTSGMTKAQIENMEITQQQTTATDQNTSALGKLGSTVDKTADKIKKLRDTIGDGFKTTLDKAKSALASAQEAFNDFSKSVSEAVTESFSFQDAYEAGKESGSGFFSALTDQATKVQDFSVLINRLMAAGLSEAALQQVLDAGVDAGSAIATEILGSADGVIRANNLVSQVASIGDQIGLNAAGQFRQAGVDAGTALVAGITEVISKYQVRLKSKKLTTKQLKKLREQFAVDVSFAFAGSGLPELANGAIVSSRTPAIIGEAGPEAVIPISRPARALQLMEQTGLASLARNGSGAAVNIENATFVAPVDADLVAQKVLVAERARSFG
jgi:hypothetical protein